MVIGFVWMKTQYTREQVIGVLAVTLGVILATLASGNFSIWTLLFPNASTEPAPPVKGSSDFFLWAVGMIILTISLIMSSALGVAQEYAYNKFGRHSDEAMFYSHFLSLPCFIVFWQDIVYHIHQFNILSPYSVNLGVADVPVMWLYLLGNCATQWLCVYGVFTLISCTSSLTGTFVLSIRKFLSLCLSIYLFNNAFSAQHWVGTGFVLLGTIYYTLASSTKDKEKKSK